jgi:predicted HAD superfamily phosphohydrolase
MAMIHGSIMSGIPNRETSRNESSPLDDLQDKVREILSKIIPTSGVDEEELMEKIRTGKPDD